MMEETGNLVSGCWACILEFSESGQARGLERIQKARKAGPWAKSVYSKIQGPGRFLVDSVYRKLEKPGPRAESVYSKIQGQGRLLVPSVYRKPEEPVYSDFQGSSRLLVRGVYSMFEEPGPEQNQYTQKFRARTGSVFLAYTACSKSLDPGRISILKKSEPKQAPGS